MRAIHAKVAIEYNGQRIRRASFFAEIIRESGPLRLSTSLKKGFTIRALRVMALRCAVIHLINANLFQRNRT